MNYVSQQSAGYYAANNPLRPRKKKVHRVSYYRTSEIDKNQRAPLYVMPIWSGNAAQAEASFSRGKPDDSRIVRTYIATGLPPLSGKLRHIYVGSPDFRPPTLAGTRLPLRSCPECGAELPKHKHFCPDCAHKRKNRKQIETKAMRVAEAESEGRHVCQVCTCRPVSKRGQTCDHCHGYTVGRCTDRTPIILKRLTRDLPRAVERLLTSQVQKCHNHKTYSGDRFPACGCRTCLAVWIPRQAARYVSLMK